MQEIELKYRLHSPDEMRKRLAQAGFAFHGRVAEVNQMFDDEAGALRRARQALRLRTATQCDEQVPTARQVQHTLTFKGPPQRGNAKTREEIETLVDDVEAARMILTKLGFALRFEYRKTRETWTRGPCEVVLDELANIGSFLEIEGDSETCVLEVAQELQLSQNDLEHRSYAELTRLHDAPH